MPHHSEEENLGLHIADQHKCSACQAIAHQMDHALNKKSRHNGGKRLKEWQYSEVMEEVCDNVDVWNEYGLKRLGEENVLQGPGIPQREEELTPDGPLISMVATKKGGYWAHRLGQRCHAYLGELGEEELYEMHIHGIMGDRMCKDTCARSQYQFAGVPKMEETTHTKEGKGNRKGKPKNSKTKPKEEL
eukprot:CAMPEP_0114254728 /NCGR_PEP_ID=MMETSP0058-20121206/17160_1 /TAXON_ID=36894 /ORGANISM="Pyramimonas parkeae, CCMP726" /LENGTH=188 /DNA_ID=CAMNT_0001369019 /DNA_START=325 /DNA_END=891 /DNA_ORIENTATION=+